MRRFTSRQERAFTLTELMIVVGVIALLMALLLPVVKRAREGANRVACASNLRQVGGLLLNYSVQNNAAYPRTKYTAGAAATYFTGPSDTDPFTGANVSANDVTAALFLLARTQGATANLFVCPSSQETPDNFGNTAPKKRANFTSSANLSYSFQCPYPDTAGVAAGYRWTNRQKPNFVLMADLNPGVGNPADNVTTPTATSSAKQQQIANSRNHNKAGQNVLFADGHVEFAMNVFVGVNGDNIYTRQGATALLNDTTIPLGVPATRDDTSLFAIDPTVTIAAATTGSGNTTGNGTTTGGTTTGNGNGNANGNGNGNSTGNGNSNGNANGNGNSNGNANGNGNGNANGKKGG